MSPIDDAACIPSSLANGRFTVVGKLGQGNFGDVRIGRDEETGEEVAVKFEELLSGFLDYEITVLSKLQDGEERIQGFARLLYSGVEGGGQFRCLVMERLGMNLMQCMQACGGRFTLTTTALVAEQAIACLEFLHSKRIVHCDLKPENFVCGRKERSHHVYLVDFGLATEYHDGRHHLPSRSLSEFRGNFRFAARGTHRCEAPCRRDDLEALGYMLIFLMRGSLPWSGISSTDWRIRNKRILCMKESMDPDEIAAGLPTVLADFLHEVRELNYAQRPDYLNYSNLFAEERERLCDELEVVVKDHDMQWVDRAELGSPEMIQTRTNVAQPDDSIVVNAIKRAISRGSVLSRKFDDARSIVSKKLTERQTPRRAADNSPGASEKGYVSDKTPVAPARSRWRISCACGGGVRVCEPEVVPSGRAGAANSI